MTLHLHDTRLDRIVAFEPGPVVKMYVCGITPYDSTHLGHAATYLTYDLVVRRLEDLGHLVEMVRNFTDVDDSILPKARELGIDFLELAETEIARFHKDMADLNTRPPFSEPRATEWVYCMVELIENLARAGHTYTVDGTTWFDVTTSPGFGNLSGYDEATMVELARERGGTPDDPRQRHPLDFVLWLPSAADEPCWESPFGPGRPGWHIECSAMGMAALGPVIDLHGGGSDLIFPHHECEVVQSESVTGSTFVKHWMHTEMVYYQGEKMSKSLGNLVFVSDLVERGDARAVRLALMRHHYRTPFEWFDEEFDRAMDLLGRLLEAASGATGPQAGPLTDAVRAALDADLDTPAVVSLLEDAAVALVGAAHRDVSAASDLAAASALVGVDLLGEGIRRGSMTSADT